MKRNTIFGAAALLVAGAAIGAGSVVSQNAMADTGTPAQVNELTMVHLAADGTAVECTFSGADAADLLPAGLPTDASVQGDVVIGMAEISAADGSLPVLQVPADGQLPVGSAGVVTIEAGVGTGAIAINGTSASTREGSADECAAMRTQLTQVTPSMPGDGTPVAGGSGVVVSGNAVVVSTGGARP